MTDIDTETVIIGGGQTGVPLARALAAEGRPVILIERAHLGGSCVNFGCTPSKAVIASARLAADARKAARLGILIPQIEVDFRAVMDRARELVAQSKNELDASFVDRDNPHLLTGHARLEGIWVLLVRAGETLVRAERVVLDTGARTAPPSIPGLDEVPLINAETGSICASRRSMCLCWGEATSRWRCRRRFGGSVALSRCCRRLTSWPSGRTPILQQSYKPPSKVTAAKSA